MTDEQRPTPGPWNAIWMIGQLCIVTSPPNRIQIAECVDRYDNASANARLMAAAPDLLEASRLAESILANYGGGHTLDMLRAAIAKAEGRDDG